MTERNERWMQVSIICSLLCHAANDAYGQAMFVLLAIGIYVHSRWTAGVAK